MLKKQNLCKDNKVQFIWLSLHLRDHSEMILAFNFLTLAAVGWS